MTAPIVTLSESIDRDPGWATVQYWLESKDRPECVATMTTMQSSGLSLSISQACPVEWIDSVIEAYQFCRNGVLPTPTHSLEWRFGAPPVFTVAA